MTNTTQHKTRGRPAGVTPKKNKTVFTTTISPETAMRLSVVAAKLSAAEGKTVSRGDVIDRLTSKFAKRPDSLMR